MNSQICAGIVTYNPNIQRLNDNIRAIIQQIDKLYVLDNGSSNNHDIYTLCLEYNHVVFIENKRNEGIASALNKLSTFAENDGFKWIIYIDQDSICTYNIVNAYNRYINLTNLAILCPIIHDRNIHENIPTCNGIEAIHKASDVITSGSCINIAILKKLGGFDERLFIDFVDTDYNQRVIEAGYTILRIKSIYILHEVGKISSFRIGPLVITCTNHSAIRRYYMVRNRLYYKRKYFGYLAYLKEKARLILGGIKIILFENDKIDKTKAMISGMKDYKKLLHS